MTALIDELEYYHEVDLPIFQQELADWLPERIFDVHVHTWLPEHVLSPIASQRVSVVFEAEHVPYEDLEGALELLLPGKQVEYLAFGMPLMVIDRAANNAYVAEHIDQKRSFGLYVPRLPDDAETLWGEIKQGGFAGFKPYLAYATWKMLEEISILDFVREAQLEVAHEHGLIIMLHVPRNTRLADPQNLADLEVIAKKYPNAKIILAHGGRAYARNIIEPALNVVQHLPNMYFDFSNVQSQEVVQAILERMPLDRLMYGSDIPCATIRGYMFMLNGQRLTITRKQFPWSLSSQRPGELRCTFMGYEQIRAMKHACDALKFSREQVEQLFYSNARNLVMNALRDVTASA